jgi:hypothetical protein
MADLSGNYVHAGNPSFRYIGSDDGQTLSLVLQSGQPDSGAPVVGGNRISVHLARTPRGFVGQTRATVFVLSGQSCAIEFPTELISCDDGGVVLRSATTAAVDESCRPPQGGSRGVMAEHRLLRTLALSASTSPDAGSLE